MRVLWLSLSLLLAAVAAPADDRIDVDARVLLAQQAELGGSFQGRLVRHRFCRGRRGEIAVRKPPPGCRVDHMTVPGLEGVRRDA